MPAAHTGQSPARPGALLWGRKAASAQPGADETENLKRPPGARDGCASDPKSRHKRQRSPLPTLVGMERTKKAHLFLP